MFSLQISRSNVLFLNFMVKLMSLFSGFLNLRKFLLSLPASTSRILCTDIEAFYLASALASGRHFISLRSCVTWMCRNFGLPHRPYLTKIPPLVSRLTSPTSYPAYAAAVSVRWRSSVIGPRTLSALMERERSSSRSKLLFPSDAELPKSIC